MKGLSKRIDINIYKNYRVFLEDYFKQRQLESDGKFSYRQFSKEAGFGSPNYLPMIIAGKKNLSHEGIYRIAQAMELARKDTEIFETMVYFNQSKKPEEQKHYFDRLLQFKGFSIANTVTKDQYSFLTSWYNVAIRELVSLVSFKPNLFWIAKKLAPNITAQQSKEALELLERLGLIKKDKGKWKTTAEHIKTDPIINDFVAYTFHEQMIDLAKSSLKQPANSRDISAVTMSVSLDQFTEIKKKLATFRDEIQTYLNESTDKPDRVVQFNYQLFHLSNHDD
ncbi:MAG: hypothetical protein ACD_73C00148G0002 [uncultured bacterium]|nr:MAG: hypothetical protein ACD_73C00148G0002 [uncultured bacterium]